ncbi:MAG: hypothetical protein A3C85_00725 [Candidatus Doudnabacteria bacterium RIFCSPHIGHO2_02_FULL_48_21]|nr:MAG: hypothetical protein A3K05_04715 [Candidatus Doudnabacteria bacterium RIFCSPHIGHO2_01_48_18]OGE77287.1 MAG: hypothetical protein A2668_02565 [Candidatus Doudnabacteria bacterium RIFCSPHIGHO2_01_FULL_48_180]OGE91032.1 MAG: hypothetical protein A3F44_01765 [Candidatus Doudnabacteria bacterium RIFCSPHIGHO2_12_FULL_47_25]OGE92827.1 MAG: hypothetical protein A3C85_00725 [Candidatus Doudnabacteria bacterium RIFCSPHIGHO2_02_FULL_48_21]OGE96858.1 MAG: hypothetical protein A3A83_03960 [Candidatu
MPDSKTIPYVIVRTLLLITLMASLVTAELPQQPSANAPRISVDGIIQLHKSGLSEGILVTRIKQANQPLQLSDEDLVKLSQAKVPERVIQVLMDPTLNVAASAVAVSQPAAPTVIVTGDGGIPIISGTASTRASGATTDDRTAAGDPNDPNATHDSGIYLHFINKLKQPEMTLLEPAAYTGQKQGGRFLSSITYGIAKTKEKAVLQGAKASLRTKDHRPVFYFYFEDKAAALGKGSFLSGGAAITSPNQFVLLKLETKKSTRETIVLEQGAFGGSSGTHQESIVTFKSERIRPGLYKVTPDKDLKPGEYCFLAGMGIGGAQMAGAAMPLQIFDFGVPVEY